jgi:hypothetical protein
LRVQEIVVAFVIWSVVRSGKYIGIEVGVMWTGLVWLRIGTGGELL